MRSPMHGGSYRITEVDGERVRLTEAEYLARAAEPAPKKTRGKSSKTSGQPETDTTTSSED